MIDPVTQALHWGPGSNGTANMHPPKTSEHLMTQSNSHSKRAQNTLTKIMLGEVAGVSDLEVLRPLSSP